MTTISPSVSSGEHAARSFAARRHGAFIDGRFEVLDGAEPLVVENPATEEQLLATAPASPLKAQARGADAGDAPGNIPGNIQIFHWVHSVEIRGSIGRYGRIGRI